MRNLLLASAAVIATFAAVSGEAKADFWATLNVNYGYVDGDLWVHDFSADRKSTLGTANIGALTVNDNEENIKVRVKGPLVNINVNQAANNNNSQAASASGSQSNDTGDQTARAGAAAGAIAGAAAGLAFKADADADARARAGAAAGNLALVDQDNRLRQDVDNKNRQLAGNLAIIHVEDPFGGLLDCGCSADDFYTANINYGNVSGDIHAGDFTLNRGSSLTAANVGAATINSSLNNMSVKVGGYHH